MTASAPRHLRHPPSLRYGETGAYGGQIGSYDVASISTAWTRVRERSRAAFAKCGCGRYVWRSSFPVSAADARTALSRRGLDADRETPRRWDMPSKPIPGSTGEVLTCLPSPYLPHAATGLLYLPRFLAKCRYVKEHGSLPASYAKNYKRGLDRFLCMHLGIEPAAVESIVHTCIEQGVDEGERDRRLLALLPSDVRATAWNRELVQKGMTPAGREFMLTALTAMGCSDRLEEIKSVPDLIDFDEGRIE